MASKDVPIHRLCLVNLYYPYMQSTVSLINPVFGKSQMMFEANVKSLHIIANVSQVSLTLHLQCVLFSIHIFQIFVVWQRRVSKEVYGILLHFLEEEERSRTCYPTTTCFKHALPDYNLNMAIMNKSKEREKPH